MNALTVAVFALLAVAASAAPQTTTPIPIVSYNFDGPNPDGSYAYNYQTGNGIAAAEQGHVRQINNEEVALQATGEYAYTDVNGNPIKVTYVADENGFQPKGEHLPTPPPLPAAILRALEYIAAHPEEEQEKPKPKPTRFQPNINVRRF